MSKPSKAIPIARDNVIERQALWEAAIQTEIARFKEYD